MSNLKSILKFLEKDIQFRGLVESARGLKEGQGIPVSLVSALRPYLMAGLFSELKKTMLVVTASSDRAYEFFNDLRNYLLPTEAYILPDLEVLPFERLHPNREIVGKRMEIFHLLKSKAPMVVVASVKTLLRKLPPPQSLLEPLILKKGQEIPFDSVLHYLVEAGYVRASLVEGRGEFSVRGGIIDIFSTHSFHPVRVEFFGDTVDSLREFTLTTQGSISSLKEATVFPCQEGHLDQRAGENAMAMRSTFFDYLPPGSLLVLDETKDIEDTAKKFFKQCQGFLAERLHFKSVHPSIHSYYLAPQEFDSALLPRLEFISLKKAASVPGGIEFKSSLIEPFLGKLERLKNFLESEILPKDRITTFISLREGTLERIGEVIKEWGYDASKSDRLAKINLVEGDLNHGFIMEGAKLCLISEGDIFGVKRKPRLERQTKESFSTLQLADLKVADFVVHKNYGIAKYGGLVQKEVDGAVRDYLLLEYAGKDRLYIPLDQIKKVFRYVGADTEPKLSRLGSGAWSRTKQRVKKALRDLAFDLLNLYAHRRQGKGFSFSTDTPWQRELEETFPFEETPDQAKTIDEVKRDMEAERPMDRLVCGDVGYGKTEVAIRAAFKAVLDGKQVMVLAPTTILAQQHFSTFRERFAPFPVFVEMLSRFRSQAAQREIVGKFKNGEVDVIIGTQRLLQKDIFPKDLGLVIVDEEQRFGVSHKESLKEMKKTVDVLTLSATPIPRTLQMSLTGLRDLSLIDTPPEDRYPILTYVGEYGSNLAKQPIRRELEREGQVYYVHNRVETIDKVFERVKKLVPEARVTIAHGQMKEKDLEKVMLDFLAKKYDVLVCTTIIESGLDIPSVNTIVVEEAENLGLAQLYQLRGRVGRSDHRAYAYFFFSPKKLLSTAALERLKTIGEFTELGSGLKIALRDLEIRGAGNLLGPEQHGHLVAVGFELYCELLEEAVREIEGRPVPKEIEMRIDLPVEAYLPDTYIKEEFLRIEAYREIAGIKSVEQAQSAVKKLEDRYGPLPQPAKSVINVAKIKVIANDLEINEVRWRKNTLALEGIYLEPEQLSSLGQKHPGLIYYSRSQSLLFPKIYPDKILPFLNVLFGDIMLLVKKLQNAK